MPCHDDNYDGIHRAVNAIPIDVAAVVEANEFMSRVFLFELDKTDYILL